MTLSQVLAQLIALRAQLIKIRSENRKPQVADITIHINVHSAFS